MGTVFECLHRALEDKTVSSVNADIGAIFYLLQLVQQFSIALREILYMRFVEEQRSYTRYYGSMIGSRGVVRIRDGYVELRRCFGFE